MPLSGVQGTGSRLARAPRATGALPDKSGGRGSARVAHSHFESSLQLAPQRRRCRSTARRPKRRPRSKARADPKSALPPERARRPQSAWLARRRRSSHSLSAAVFAVSPEYARDGNCGASSPNATLQKKRGPRVPRPLASCSARYTRDEATTLERNVGATLAESAAVAASDALADSAPTFRR